MKNDILVIMCKIILIFAFAFFSQFAFADSSAISLSECRSRIEDIICVVDPVDYNNPFANQYNRPCLDGGEKFIKIFQSHFDQSKPIIKRMYCSLEKIWIENTLSTTAYASPIYDSANNLVSAAIGVKRDFLENPLELNMWLAQKENSSFGPESDLFKYSAALADKKYKALSYAINHEFGHIFDYANHLNRYDEDCQLEINPKACVPAPGSWGEISWASATNFSQANESKLLSSLCFYNCHEEFLNPSTASPIMESLLKTNFQSTYATVNPKEDWAEVFAIYLATKDSGLKLKALTKNHEYNLTEHFLSDKLKAKRAFVEKFLNGYIKYPGE
jgi:hypothetical protein